VSQRYGVVRALEDHRRMSERVCELCRRPIWEGEPVVAAREQKDASGFSASSQPEFADGRLAWFHETHFTPSSERWRQVPVPE
jgi:hypothetical protein